MLAVLLALSLGGCDQADPTRAALDTAEKRVKVGAYREAIRAYESALDGTEKSAEIHYKIALLYDDKLKEPLDAIHHYDRYLDFSPNGSHAKEAKIGRKESMTILETKMKKEGLMTTSEGVRLRKENDELRLLLSEARNPKKPTQLEPADPGKPDAMPPGSQQYTVKSGDTPSSIAFKFYKNRAMYRHILDANYNQLGGKKTIKPGQNLIIPELPSKKKK
jgi:nucleoid-associated protein YgaU